jgi:hypothetical protein
MWLPIIELIIKGLFFAAGAIGLSNAFQNRPLLEIHDPFSGNNSQGTNKSDLQGVVREEAKSWAANPWVWFGIAAAGFGLTFLVRQTRGLARDVGSGLRSTRRTLKEDLGDLNADPD